MHHSRHIFLIIVVLFLLAGCQRGENESGEEGEDEQAVGTVRPDPIPVSFATLNADPFTFLNRVVRVTGVYRPAVPVGCFPFSGPETRWRMIADGFELPIDGLAQVTEVAPDGLVVTIDGIWRKYEGPFGCGDEPPELTFWYLEANQVVSPNPLGGELLAQSSLATVDAAETERGAAAPTSPNPTVNLTVTLIPTPSRVIVGTVTAVPTFTPTVRVTVSATPTANSQSTPTVTPTGTLLSTSTPGPTSTGTITATPTPTQGSGNPQTPQPTSTLPQSGSGTRTAATPNPTNTPSGYPGPGATSTAYP